MSVCSSIINVKSHESQSVIAILIAYTFTIELTECRDYENKSQKYNIYV